MNKALVVICLVIAGCGNPIAAQGGSPVDSTQEPPIADVLEVTCGSEGAEVDTPRVRAFSDGVHARFENPAGAAEYWVRAVSSPDESNHGGEVPDGPERWGWSDAPGEYFIGCYAKGEHPPYYEIDPGYARYEVVDIDTLWISWTPECKHADEVESVPLPEATSIQDVETWIRERFNIHDGERIRPGYPETEWKGNPWVIRREDRTLVHFHAMEEDGLWTVHRAEGCILS